MTDQTSGEPKGLKHAVICAGVERLIEDKGWERKKVMLWIDWQSVYQDRDDEKDKALRSLVKYATSCKAMLIPTDYGTVAEAPERVEQIRGYGTRGFCRLEVLVYALWRAIRQGGFHPEVVQGVELYAAMRDGTIRRYIEVFLPAQAGDLPDHGEFSTAEDRKAVHVMQEMMLRRVGMDSMSEGEASQAPPELA